MALGTRTFWSNADYRIEIRDNRFEFGFYSAKVFKRYKNETAWIFEYTSPSCTEEEINTYIRERKPIVIDLTHGNVFTDPKFKETTEPSHGDYSEPDYSELTKLSNFLYAQSESAGWWDDLGKSVTMDKYVLATKLALVHSEVSEALEGLRKDTDDDHLPHRSCEEVEIADAVIRLLDYAAARGYDLGTILKEKQEYNARRKDHKAEVRAAQGGKKF